MLINFLPCASTSEGYRKKKKKKSQPLGSVAIVSFGQFCKYAQAVKCPALPEGVGKGQGSVYHRCDDLAKS